MYSKNMGIIANRIAVVLMTSVAVITLSACSVSEEQIEQDIAALEARGFQDPVFVGGSTASMPSYDVGVGTCTITVRKANSEWGWAYKGVRHVDAGLIRENQQEFGLGHCFV